VPRVSPMRGVVSFGRRPLFESLVIPAETGIQSVDVTSPEGCAARREGRNQSAMAILAMLGHGQDARGWSFYI